MKKVLVPTVLVICMALGVYLVDRLLAAAQGSGAAEPSGNGDVNGSGRIDISDPVYLLNWLFNGGPDPVAIAGSPELEARVRALESRVEDLQGALPGAEGWERALASLVRILEPEKPASVLPPGALRKVLREPGATNDASFFIDQAQFGELAGFIAREEISRPFECLVLLRTTTATRGTRDLVGRSGRLLFHRGGRVTAWSGVVSEAGLAGYDGAGALYTVKFEPSLARLRGPRGYRVFQGETSLSIVDEVLEASGVPLPELRIEGTYPPRDFAAQYRESSLDFVTRLMEEEGIYYFFDHTEEGHAMVMANTPAGYGQEPSFPIIYRGHEAGPSSPGEEYIHRFQLRSAQFTGSFTVRGHDFESGELPTAAATAPEGEGEAYEYESANVLTDAGALRLASIRLGEALGRSEPGHGASSSGELRAGHLFTLEGSTGDRFDGKYLVTAVTHRYVNPPGGDGGYYGNEFTCIPASVPFRPARRTPVPRMAGVETAVVTGPPGEEIHTDKYGRVKVQFHWDRTRSSDESSVWIRMATPVAGKDRGMFMLPEVGDEVLVAFEHGDIRFPYVLGSLWNGTTPPPHEQPAGKTLSSLGTNRSLFTRNEIVFDDTAGREGIEVHAPLLELAAPATVAQGTLRSVANAGPGTTVAPGERYRDNAIVAWARVAAVGGAQSEFGVKDVLHPVPGVYVITLDASASGLLQLVAIATPVITNPPRSSEDLRIASVTEVDNDAFEVHINDGTGRSVDGAFVFLATAR